MAGGLGGAGHPAAARRALLRVVQSGAHWEQRTDGDAHEGLRRYE